MHVKGWFELVDLHRPGPNMRARAAAAALLLGFAEDRARARLKAILSVSNDS